MNGPILGELATWLAIVAQLYTSRMEALLKRHQFTLPQFSLLTYLARHADQPQTISMMANALEVNQPGVTKIVKKLEGMGLVESRRDSADSRRKYVSITEAGFGMIGQVQGQLAPDVTDWFADWNEAEQQAFLAHLQKLGGWLDNNRL